MEPSLELCPALLCLPVVLLLLDWAEIRWEISAWCRTRQENLVCCWIWHLLYSLSNFHLSQASLPRGQNLC